MTYASERGFKVGEEYVVKQNLWKGSIVLFVKDDGTLHPEFQEARTGEYLFIHMDNFDIIKDSTYIDKTPETKQILLKYIDEKYYEDDFLKYLISLV